MEDVLESNSIDKESHMVQKMPAKSKLLKYENLLVSSGEV